MRQQYKLTIIVGSLAAAGKIETLILEEGGSFEIAKHSTAGRAMERKHHRVTPEGIAQVKNYIKQHPNASDKAVARRAGTPYSSPTINRIRNDQYDSRGKPRVKG